MIRYPVLVEIVAVLAVLALAFVLGWLLDEGPVGAGAAVLVAAVVLALAGGRRRSRARHVVARRPPAGRRS